ncbi:MAG: hypothetical protein MRERC_1c205 [Mycoplasmataceae bacterium RC_NB112A]|nr:MAG: hypothetical protein MRERC_1c205 [Mycoplasmataceae bacterium RC_NB112A]
MRKYFWFKHSSRNASCFRGRKILISLPDYFYDIKNRIKEDLTSRGSYNPNQPLTLEEIKQKWTSSGPGGTHIKN